MEKIFASYIGEKAEKVIQEFRIKALDKFKNERKGAIKKALLEAIEKWVKAN